MTFSRETYAGTLAFGVGVAFWPGTAGASLSPRWALIACGIVLVRNVELTTGHIAALWLLFWSAATLLWSPLPIDGVDAWLKLLFLVGAFWLGSSLSSLRAVFIGMGAALCINGAIALAQAYAGFDWFHQTVPPAGLFMNKNSLAEIAVLVFVGCLALRLYWALPLVAAAVLLPFSRGAVLALAAALALWTGDRRVMVATFGGGAAAVLALYLSDAGGVSVHDRLAYWRDTVSALTLFGSGAGSFNNLYPSFASIDTLAVRPDHAHNDWLELVFEIGLGALPLLLAIPALRRNARARAERLVLAAMAVEMVFAFPLQMPATAFVAALCLGQLCRGGDPVLAAVAGRRSQLQARRAYQDARGRRARGAPVSATALSAQRCGL